MTFDEYQIEANKTMVFEDTEKDTFYCLAKLSEELGELSGMIAKHYKHNTKFDYENFVEEVGDILWYLAAISRVFDTKLSSAANYNIAKLRVRHGERYNPKHYNGDNNE